MARAGPTLSRHAGHLAALVRAAVAFHRTSLAMSGLVLFALRAAGLANLRTQTADFLGKLRSPAHRCRSGPAHFGAVSIQANAIGHLGNRLFDQACGGAVLTRLGALDTCFDASGVLVPSHNKPPVSRESGISRTRGVARRVPRMPNLIGTQQIGAKSRLSAECRSWHPRDQRRCPTAK